MDLHTVFDFIIVFIGFWIGFFQGAKLQHESHLRVMQEVTDEIKQKIIDVTVFAKVEVRNDVMYAYDKETHRFLCQGTDPIAVVEAFKARFPEKILHVEEIVEG